MSGFTTEAPVTNVNATVVPEVVNTAQIVERKPELVELERRCKQSLELTGYPEYAKNFVLPLSINDFAKEILSAIDDLMSPDDIALIIGWNPEAFYAAGRRNGIPGHTKTALITHFTSPSYNGIDAYDLGYIFLFKSGYTLSESMFNLPAWVQHVPGQPDVARFTFRFNKLTETGVVEWERYEFVFKKR